MTYEIYMEHRMACLRLAVELQKTLPPETDDALAIVLNARVFEAYLKDG